MGSIVKLDGQWDFCFDPVDTGMIDQWYRKKPAQTRQVSIPHVWSLEPNEENAHIAYYFHEFIVDKKESPKRFFLRFESVHLYATIWLNGDEIGAHFGGQIQFDLDGSKSVRIGEKNFLAIRVQSLDRQGKIMDQPAAELALGAAFQKAPFAGLTGDVYLFMAGKAGVRALICFPDYEADRVTVEVKFWNPKNFQAELEITLTTPDGESGTMPKSVKFDKENATYSLNLQLDNVKIWHVNDPQLYKVKVSLNGSYDFETRFGMRSTDIEKGVFKLNHQAMRVRGVGYSWLFAFHHGLPAFKFDVRKEIQTIKDAGFNLIRTSGSPIPNAVLDACDEIGILVLEETPCFNQKSSKEGLDILKQHIQSMVDSHGSHPSIFGWVVGSENGSMVLENGNKLLRHTAEMDPSRPVFSNLCSVNMDSLGGGKIDLGKVFQPSGSQISPFESHKLRIGFPVSVKTYTMLAGYCSSRDGKTIMDGIHGSRSFWERYNYLKDDLDGKVLVDGLGIGAPENPDELLSEAKSFADSSEVKELEQLNLELSKILKENGLKIWKDAGGFWNEAMALGRQALAKQVEALIINPQISGYILEMWADYNSVFAGLTDWFRKPKSSLDVARKVNRPIHVIAEAEDRTPYIGTSAAIKIHMVNEGHLGDYGLLLRVKGPNGRIWHQESLPGKAKPGVNLVGRFKFPVGFEKGKFTFDLNLSKNNKEIARTEEVFFVPAEAKLDSVLKQTHLKGNFPDTITCSTQADAPITIVTDFSMHSDSVMRNTFDKAVQGSTLVLGNLTDEDARRINALKLLPWELNCFRSTGSLFGSYHYALNTPEFKDLPNQCILDQTYADVFPFWSLEPIANATVAAGSLNLTNSSAGHPKIKWGIDLAYIPLGKGKLIFYQFDIFSKLGKNALADTLFANLVNAQKK